MKIASTSRETKTDLDWFRSAIKHFSKAVFLFRVNIVVAGILSVLYVNNQTVDIIRALTDFSHFTEFPRLVLATSFVFVFMPLTTWYFGRWLSIKVLAEELHEETFYGWLLRWIPRACAVFPLCVMAWCIIAIGGEGEELFVAIAAVCVVVSFAWLLFFHIRNKDKSKFIQKAVDAENRIYAGIAFFALLIVIVLVWVDLVTLPQFLGTIPTVLIFFCVFTACATFLAYRFEKAGVPWLSIGLIWTIVWSLTPFTDNHEIHLTKLEAPQSEQPLLETDFENWLEKRKDDWGGRNSNTPYPVFIFAAEGGGIYAAQNAAFTLGRLEDLSNKVGAEKPFSHHTFAISGISGGSVGVTMFASHIADKPGHRSGETVEKTMASILNADLLSPVAANMFSLDYLQRFIPLPFIPDRAAALEEAIAKAWLSEHKSRAPLDQPFSALGAGSTDYPALVLNAAELKSGRTVASARFRFSATQSEEKQIENLLEADGQRQTFREILKPIRDGEKLHEPLEKCEDFDNRTQSSHASGFKQTREMSVLKSAVTSARFPYISPAGFLYRRDVQNCGNDKKLDVVYRTQYVDGGYVESSGAEPALTILKRLNKHILRLSKSGDKQYKDLQNKVKLHLVTIELGQPNSFKDSRAGEITAPPLGLLAVWNTRSRFSKEQAIDFVESFTEEKPNKPHKSAIGGIHRIQPFDAEKQIPLGWRLSRKTSLHLRKLLCSQEPHALQIKEGLHKVDAPFVAITKLVNLISTKGSSHDNLQEICKPLMMKD